MHRHMQTFTLWKSWTPGQLLIGRCHDSGIVLIKLVVWWWWLYGYVVWQYDDVGRWRSGSRTHVPNIGVVFREATINIGRRRAVPQLRYCRLSSRCLCPRCQTRRRTQTTALTLAHQPHHLSAHHRLLRTFSWLLAAAATDKRTTQAALADNHPYTGI